MSCFMPPKRSAHNGLFVLSLFVFLSFSLASCDLAENYTKIDRASNMDIQDFRDGFAERTPELPGSKNSKLASSGIPPLQPYISMTPESIRSVPLVSVSVNQSIPLRDILYELAQQAEYDLELDPNIRGSIIFTARDKPFDVVIKRIADVAGLRYEFKDSFLRVELDTPYNKTYKIDYLSYIRTNAGSVSTNVSVVSGEGADTGSSYSASSESVSDFWGELDLSMRQILGGASTGGLRTKTDPRITAVTQNPEVDAVSPSPENADGTIQPPEAVLRIETLPVEDNGDDSEEVEFTFSLNKQAGMVNVYASQKLHKEIDIYLDLLKRSVTAQVLIEAKIFEVSLFDEYITGIDWQIIHGEGVAQFASATGSSLLRTIESPGPLTGAEALFNGAGGTVAATQNLMLGAVGNDFQGLLQAISGFGTVRALASPRLTVLNNQSAVLNVATNKVYFEIDLEATRDDTTGDLDIEIDSKIKSVPEGVLVNVQPSINLKSRTISMAVRPTITRIVGTVFDPAVNFVAATIPGGGGITSAIPEVNIQEIDTVINVRSGQPVVMGGLLQDRVSSLSQSVPVLGELPILGGLFRKSNDSINKTELVIFLKATLIENGSDTIDNADRDLYRAFSGDRRPLKL